MLFMVLVIPFELLNRLFHFKNNINNPYIENSNTISFFVLSIFIAPLFETLFFQYGIIKTFTYFNPNTKFISVFVSSVFFALNHWFGIVYVIYTFFMGLFFGFLYFTSEKRGFKPYWVIVAVHALHNLTVSVLNEISK